MDVAGCMRRTAEYSEEFLTWARARRWRNPATGNKVLFDSLPSDEQARIHARWDHHWGVRHRMEDVEAQEDLEEEAYRIAKRVAEFDGSMDLGEADNLLGKWIAGDHSITLDEAIGMLSLRERQSYLDPEWSDGPRNVARGLTKVSGKDFEEMFGFRPQGENGVVSFEKGRWVQPGRPLLGTEPRAVSSWTGSSAVAHKFGVPNRNPWHNEEAYDVILIAPTTGNHFFGDGDEMYNVIYEAKKEQLEEEHWDEAEKYVREQLDRSEYANDDEYEDAVREKVYQNLEEYVSDNARDGLWENENERVGVGPVRLTHILWKRSGVRTEFPPEELDRLMDLDIEVPEKEPAEELEMTATDEDEEELRVRVERFEEDYDSSPRKVAQAWFAAKVHAV